MKALQFIGDNRCQVTTSPSRPSPTDEVLLASRSVGICHSDLELLAGRYIIPFDFPVIPGHEWSGEVVAGGIRRQGPAAGATGSSASASSGRTTSGSASAAPQPNSSWRRKRGCTAFPTTCPGRRGRSSSRSAAATTQRCAPTTSTRATRPWCSGPGPIGLGVVAAAAGQRRPGHRRRAVTGARGPRTRPRRR